MTDLKIPLNIFRRVTDVTPIKTLMATAKETVGLFRMPRTVAAKELAGLVTPCEYKGPAAGRSTANIALVHAIAGDIDGGFCRAKFDGGMSKLEEAGVFAVAYQTWNSTPEAERWRVFVFLDMPIPPDQYRECWEGLNALFGGTLDPNAKDAARLSYLPGCPQGQTRRVLVINEELWC
jgi:hypothetical protein